MAKSALSSTKFPDVNAEIMPKHIFQFLWPGGPLKNPHHGNPKYPKANPYFVRCNHCGEETEMVTKAAYGNPVKHALNKHYKTPKSLAELHGDIRTQREEGGASTGIQETLSKLWNQGTPMEQALFTWVKLVCLHNEPFAKMSNDDFCSLLKCDKVSYPVLVKMLLELSLIVEEKIAKEMKGKVGVIMHDGWSKFARHYICLLAVYMVASGRKPGPDEVKVMKPVITMLTCTTLPYTSTNTDENGNEIDGETYFLPYSFVQVHSS
jgi:hypothetical protein